MKPKLHTVFAGMYPNACVKLAAYAEYGSAKHNPGEPLHWAFDKSSEHAESAARHLAQCDQIDPETGESHALGLLCRAFMLLETQLIAAGAKPGFAVVMTHWDKADLVVINPELPTARPMTLGTSSFGVGKGVEW